ncbi:MAG: SurA N-terminal domain-containing protein [Spirochaetales bacterium]|nr:SurA N-terminal domain-containing protein [Spirochaetales bacterium]
MLRVIILCLLLLLTPQGMLFSDADEASVIALVNGEPIYEQELYYQLRQLEEQAMLSGSRSRTPLDYSDFEALRERVIQTMIHTRLLLQECERREITVEKHSIDIHLEILKNRFEDETAFFRFLEDSGTSPDRLKEEIHNSLLIDRLTDMLLEEEGFRVTEAACRSIYRDNISEFSEPALYRISEIVVRDKEEIETVYGKLERGESFERLAADCSISVSSSKGGDLGYYAIESLPAATREIVESLETGDTSEPFRGTDGNYRILRVTDRRAETVALYEDVKDDISRQLRAEEKNRMLSSLLIKLLADGEIVRTD